MSAKPQLKIVKRSMADLAADRIRAAILSGALPPSARLVEAALAEEIGVSRGTIRAALSELERDRLVTCARYSAWSVATLDAQRLWEIYTMRATIESGAARLVAQHVSDDDVSAIRAAEKKLDAAERGAKAAERLACDLDFHTTIVQRSGNRLLIDAYASIMDQVRWVYAVSERRSPARIDLVAWHAPLADAICRGDADEAAKLAFDLCLRSLDDDLREAAPTQDGGAA